ncbi:MAG TPA: hypothetical protein VD932_03695 [Aquabacterium sp.]|nr:hypothetical protein [Aquabacterium sp.]
MSPPTRPPSSDPDDIAKWEDDMRAYRERVAKEDEFRDTMLQFAARTDVTLTQLRMDAQAHSQEDRQQFRRERRARRRLARKVDALSGQVTQTVNTNKYNWGVVVAWASAFVAIASVGWTLIEKFGGALKP